MFGIPQKKKDDKKIDPKKSSNDPKKMNQRDNEEQKQEPKWKIGPEGYEFCYAKKKRDKIGWIKIKGEKVSINRHIWAFDNASWKLGVSINRHIWA